MECETSLTAARAVPHGGGDEHRGPGPARGLVLDVLVLDIR